MKKFFSQNKWHIISLFLIAAFGVFLVFKGVSADTLLDKVGQQEGVPKTELTTLIGNIIKVVLGVLGIVLVVLIIMAGVMWMTAGGDSGKVTKAKDMLFNAVIGLVIVMAAWAIATFVIKSLSSATSGSGTTGLTY